MKYIIVDIDGTICNTPIGLTLEQFHELDHSRLSPNLNILDKIYIKYPHNQVEFIYLTARCQSLYFVTRNWLNEYCKDIHKHNLHLVMRPLGNLDTSGVLKVSILKGLNIEPKDVIIWLDDDLDTITWGNRQGYNVVHPDKFLAGVNT